MHMPRSGSLKRALRSVLDPIREFGPAMLGHQVGKRPHPWEHSYPSGLAWDAPIEMKALTALFDEAVMRYADQVSVKFHGRRFRYREIGELLEIPEKTVKSRLFSARQRLRVILTERGFSP